MKLRVIESIDLTQEKDDEDKPSKKKSFKKPKAPSVYKRIVDMFGSEIPPMKDLPKHKKSTKIYFTIQADTVELAEIIHASSKKFDGKFQKFVEVQRAAYYLGMMILWHQFADGKVNYKDKLIYDGIVENETIEEKYQILNETILRFDTLLQYFRDGVIPESEMLEKCEKLILKVPDDLQKSAEKAFNDLYAGNSKKSVLFKKIAGRPRLVKIG